MKAKTSGGAYRYASQAALKHKMSDLEAGTDTSSKPSETRYGSINQYVLDVNGIQKWP